MTMSAIATFLTLLATTTMQVDTTLHVGRDARLNVNNFGGEIAVEAWGKNTLRIAARHSHRVRVLISESGPNIEVRAVSFRGVPARVDYSISAPVWMPLSLTGVFSDMSVKGSRGEVSAETVRGDVILEGGRGYVKLSSLQGTISADGAHGRLELSSVNGDVSVVDTQGDLTVESVNGGVLLDRVRSSRVQAASVNGDVIYLGAIERGGRYRFASHSGDLEVAMSDPADATVSVSTYSGEFESSFPVLLTKHKGKLFDFTLGKGSALVELESFGGTIKLLRADREIRKKIKEKLMEKEGER